VILTAFFSSTDCEVKRGSIFHKEKFVRTSRDNPFLKCIGPSRLALKSPHTNACLSRVRE